MTPARTFVLCAVCLVAMVLAAMVMPPMSDTATCHVARVGSC
jgi:hypothetical protein